MIEVIEIGIDADEALRGLLVDLDFSKDYNYFRRCFEDVSRSRRVLMARQDGTACGLCVLNFAPIYPSFKRLAIPEIQDLNVARDYRRAGVGSAIIAAAESIARGAGAEMVGIGVGLSSAYGNAQRLYAGLGYLPDGAGVYYDGVPVAHGEMRPVDDNLCLMMVKELSAK